VQTAKSAGFNSTLLAALGWNLSYLDTPRFPRGSSLKEVIMLTMLIRIRLLLIAVTLLALVGCGTTRPSNFYQLDEPAAIRLSGLERGIAVGVGPINVPPYLDRPQIVVRGTGHKLELSEFNRWSEPLTDSITRVMVVSLSNKLESTRVFQVPRRDKTIPLEFRADIDIARFDGSLGGNALLVARWTLYGRDEAALVTKVSIISESLVPEGSESSKSSDEVDFENLIAAQNRTLQRLSQEIVDAINANR